MKQKSIKTSFSFSQKIFLLLVIKLSIVLLFVSIQFFSINKIEAATTSTDALSVRILPNPSHLSIQRWYVQQGFKGSPQVLTVDGYEAIRDGRTVYVNASNIDEVGKKIYTNIYLISYNQEASSSTVDIFGQLVSRWKFNSNLVNPYGQCSVSTLSCSDTVKCPETTTCTNGKCSLDSVAVCSTDLDCPNGFFCDGVKSRVARDIKRLGQIMSIRDSLESYKIKNGHYPVLTGGTYIPNVSVSTWPSWQNVFSSEVGLKQYLSDPVNVLGNCSATATGYDPKTCWNDANKSFSTDITNTDSIKLPDNSFVMVYRNNNNGSNYDLCATLESSSVSYSFGDDVVSQAASKCSSTLKYAGQVNNTAPFIESFDLSAETGKEFIGSLKLVDNEGNPIIANVTFGTAANGGNWSSWVTNVCSNDTSKICNTSSDCASGGTCTDKDYPVITDTNIPGQKKIYAKKAGVAGDYYLSVSLNDGTTTSTTDFSSNSNFKITIANNKPVIQAEDVSYQMSSSVPFDYYFYFSGVNLGSTPTMKITANAGGTSSSNCSLTSCNFASSAKCSIDCDLKPNNLKLESVERIGANSYKGHINGTIAQSATYHTNTDVNFDIKVTDVNSVSDTRQFILHLLIDAPELVVNCPSEVRVNNLYNCSVSVPSVYGTKHVMTYTYTKPSWLIGTPISDTASSSDTVTFSGTPAIANQGNFSFKVDGTNEYQNKSTVNISGTVNTYCGDGVIEHPNSENRGGPQNNGFELCDRSDTIKICNAGSDQGNFCTTDDECRNAKCIYKGENIAYSSESSSQDKQYGCNALVLNSTANDSCKPVGGWCGDGSCGAEKDPNGYAGSYEAYHYGCYYDKNAKKKTDCPYCGDGILGPADATFTIDDEEECENDSKYSLNPSKTIVPTANTYFCSSSSQPCTTDSECVRAVGATSKCVKSAEKKVCFNDRTTTCTTDAECISKNKGRRCIVEPGKQYCSVFDMAKESASQPWAPSLVCSLNTGISCTSDKNCVDAKAGKCIRISDNWCKYRGGYCGDAIVQTTSTPSILISASETCDYATTIGTSGNPDRTKAKNSSSQYCVKRGVNDTGSFSASTVSENICQNKGGYCGDGATQYAYGENCDFNNQDHVTDNPDPSHASSSNRYCINTFDSPDVCTKGWTGDYGYCGNNIIEGTYGEECDAGLRMSGGKTSDDSNSTDPSRKNSSSTNHYCNNDNTCTRSAHYCGDTTTESSVYGETCDNNVTTASSKTGGYCYNTHNKQTAACTKSSYKCGDGTVQNSAWGSSHPELFAPTNGWEECEPSIYTTPSPTNSTANNPYVCESNCQFAALANRLYCGDGRVSTTYGENCDFNSTNKVTENPDIINSSKTNQYCASTSCTKTDGWCGDTNVNHGETCDPGNNNPATNNTSTKPYCIKTNQTGACTSSSNYCGDGIISNGGGGTVDYGEICERSTYPSCLNCTGFDPVEVSGQITNASDGSAVSSGTVYAEYFIKSGSSCTGTKDNSKTDQSTTISSGLYSFTGTNKILSNECVRFKITVSGYTTLTSDIFILYSSMTKDFPLLSSSYSGRYGFVTMWSTGTGSDMDPSLIVPFIRIGYNTACYEALPCKNGSVVVGSHDKDDTAYTAPKFAYETQTIATLQTGNYGFYVNACNGAFGNNLKVIVYIPDGTNHKILKVFKSGVCANHPSTYCTSTSECPGTVNGATEACNARFSVGTSNCSGDTNNWYIFKNVYWSSGDLNLDVSNCSSSNSSGCIDGIK
jgi:hypothetical protein